MNQLNHKRIAFRAPEPEDLDLFYRWENDATLWKYGSTPAPVSRFLLRDYLKLEGEDLYSKRQQKMVVLLKASGEPIGTIDLFDFDPYHNRAAIGMMIDSSFQGQGYAYETVQLLVEYAFSYLHIHQLYVEIPTSNVPCYRLFSKLNFHLCTTLKEWIRGENGYEDLYLMQLINDK